MKADISETRIKFARLDDLEGTMNREEFERLKEQVTEEYLAIFKKTVSDHEHFLRRIMQHEKMVHDHDFRIFLTFKDELEVRGRNTQEKIKGFFSNITKAADEGILEFSNISIEVSENTSNIFQFLCCKISILMTFSSNEKSSS